MERSVKERVVGATILVVLLVLIVPELLSGPKSPAPAKAPALAASESTEPMRNVTVDLTTRRATAADADTASTNESAASATDAESASAASSDPGSPPSLTPGPSSSAPTITTLKAQQPSESPPVENEAPSRSNTTAKTATTHEASHGGWAVQLGSFASRVNADNLVRQLRGHEAPAFVLATGKGTDQRFKVRVGPVADRAAAERLRLKLAKDGHAGSLVAP